MISRRWVIAFANEYAQSQFSSRAETAHNKLRVHFRAYHSAGSRSPVAQYTLPRCTRPYHSLLRDPRLYKQGICLTARQKVSRAGSLSHPDSAEEFTSLTHTAPRDRAGTMPRLPHRTHPGTAAGAEPVRPGVRRAPAHRREEKSFGAKIMLFPFSWLCFLLLTPRIAAALPASPAPRKSPLGGCRSPRLRSALRTARTGIGIGIGTGIGTGTGLTRTLLTLLLSLPPGRGGGARGAPDSPVPAAEPLPAALLAQVRGAGGAGRQQRREAAGPRRHLTGRGSGGAAGRARPGPGAALGAGGVPAVPAGGTRGLPPAPAPCADPRGSCAQVEPAPKGARPGTAGGSPAWRALLLLVFCFPFFFIFLHFSFFYPFISLF